jgi:hypothetical protein
MGRRGKTTPIINKIRIKIGRDVETFTLDRELLVGRSAAVKRVREMRGLAQAFLQDRRSFGCGTEPSTSEPVNLSLFPVEPSRCALDELELPSLEIGTALWPSDSDGLPLQATELGDPLLGSRAMDFDDGFSGSL